MDIIIYILLIGLAAGIVKGASGFGSSLVAIPLLSLLFIGTVPRTMMITANVVLNTLLIYENRSYFKLSTIKKIFPLIIAGVLFTGVGIYLSELISAQVLKYIIGVLIFFAIGNKILTINLHIKDNIINRIIFGSFSGIGNGIASVDGPPVVLYLTSIEAKKQEFKSTLATHFLVMGVMALLMLMFSGAYNKEILINTTYLTLSLIVGLLIGMFISSKLNEKRFEKVVLIILIGLGISMFL